MSRIKIAFVALIASLGLLAASPAFSAQHNQGGVKQEQTKKKAAKKKGAKKGHKKAAAAAK